MTKINLISNSKAIQFNRHKTSLMNFEAVLLPQHQKTKMRRKKNSYNLKLVKNNKKQITNNNKAKISKIWTF